jgi:hypothetical protein
VRGKRRARGESFRFLAFAWDVYRAAAILRRAPRTPTSVKVADAAQLRALIRIVDDPDGRPIDLSWPLIAVQLGSIGTLIIDGYHRIDRAIAEGVQTLPMHVLTPAEERACRIRPNRSVWANLDKELSRHLEEPKRPTGLTGVAACRRTPPPKTRRSTITLR